MPFASEAVAARLRYAGFSDSVQTRWWEAVMSMSKPKTSKTHEEHQSSEDRLDEALEETFPASDPIAIDPDEDDEDDRQEKNKSR
jgi:hypothetical protein